MAITIHWHVFYNKKWNCYIVNKVPCSIAISDQTGLAMSVDLSYRCAL